MTIADLCATFVNGRTINPKRGAPIGTQPHVIPSFVHKGLALQGLAGRIIAVDLMHWLFRMNYGAHKRHTSSIKSHTEEVDNIKVLQSLMRDVIMTCLNAAKSGVLLIFVVDGDEKQGKEDTHLHRQKQNETLKLKMAEYAAYLETVPPLSTEYQVALKEYKKYKVSSSKPEYSNALRVVEVLKSIGIPCLQSRGDAEQTCCMLVNCGMAEAVLSADSDCLAHGAAIWIRELNGQTYDAVFRDQLLSNWNISQAQLVDICVMLGTDYNKRVPDLGPQKILDLMVKHGSLDAAWPEIDEHIKKVAYRDSMKYNMTPEQYYWKIITDFNPVATRAMFQQVHPSDTCKYPITGEHLQYKRPTINMYSYLNYYGVSDLVPYVNHLSAYLSGQQFYFSEVRQPHPGVPPFHHDRFLTVAYGSVPEPRYVHTAKDKIEDDTSTRDVQQEPLIMEREAELTVSSLFGI